MSVSRQDPEMAVQFHGMWTAYTDDQRMAILNQLQAANIRSVRLDVSWAMLQPSNATSYDAWGVAFVDRVINMINAHGMSPLVTLWLTPTWANGGKGEHTLPTNPADYARVAQWAVNGWGRESVVNKLGADLGVCGRFGDVHRVSSGVVRCS